MHIHEIVCQQPSRPWAESPRCHWFRVDDCYVGTQLCQGINAHASSMHDGRYRWWTSNGTPSLGYYTVSTWSGGGLYYNYVDDLKKQTNKLQSPLSLAYCVVCKSDLISCKQDLPSALHFSSHNIILWKYWQFVVHANLCMQLTPWLIPVYNLDRNLNTAI